jgi:DNA-binding transcriptional ArsR family regulator
LPVLRVHFTTDDLLRTRFASGPAPLIELELAIAALQRRDPLFDGWRRGAAARLPSQARMLFELVPSTGTGPMFLDPVSTGLEDGLDAVLSAPDPLVHCELTRICGRGQPVTPWIRALHERDRDAWRVLGNALRAGHDALIQVAWPRIWQSFREDVAGRSHTIAESGLMAALETLHPSARWRGDTLEIDAEVALSVRPAGRGVTLLPSAFWTGRPLIGDHPDSSTLIIYGAQRPLPLVDLPDGDAALADLLGRTRAAILTHTAAPCSTSELARAMGISTATASEHARTLRSAGLLVSRRAGKAVLHSLTPLGERLLSGSHAAPRPAVPPPAAFRSQTVLNDQ